MNLFLLMAILYANESTHINNPQKVFDFANYLYNSHNYKEAITEYERALFIGADTSRIFLQLGRTHSLLGNCELAREYLLKIPNDTSFILLGFSWLEQREIGKAQFAFSQVKDEAQQEKTKNYYSKLLDLPHKNLFLAGISSTIIPGLGKAYSDRLGDGLFSFFFTVGSSAVSYYYYKKENYGLAIGFGTLGALFYMGNIYGSVKGAKLFNERVYRDELNRFKRDFDYLY